MRTDVTPSEKLLYRVDEAAQMLSLSRAKAYELIASGKLPSIQVDGCRRVSRKAMLAFIEGLELGNQ